MTGKGHAGLPAELRFLIHTPVTRNVFAFVKIHQTRALCTRLDAPDSSTPSSVLKKCLLQAATIFHCISHVTPLPFLSCRSSSCSNPIYPASTSSSSGIHTPCSRSISSKVRPVHPSSVLYLPAVMCKSKCSQGPGLLGWVRVQVTLKIFEN